MPNEGVQYGNGSLKQALFVHIHLTAVNEQTDKKLSVKNTV
jgi:hypothetical protein